VGGFEITNCDLKIPSRRLLEADKSLARKFKRLERKLASHDQTTVGILATIRKLMNPPEPRRRAIGFTADLQE
jgi:hypothetical protein